MKRSEMLSIIEREIELSTNRYGEIIVSPAQIAVEILSEIEQAGMLPPDQTKEWESGHGRGMTTIRGEWEPEDEPVCLSPVKNDEK